MPFEYGRGTGEKKERIEEEVTVVSVAAQPYRGRKGEFEYVNFVLDNKVMVNIKGEEKEVADKITTFPDTQGDVIIWDKDMPQVIKDLDEATERGTKPVKVKVTYYIGSGDSKRARITDLAKWEIVK